MNFSIFAGKIAVKKGSRLVEDPEVLSAGKLY
jgi:hypothetical protein